MQRWFGVALVLSLGCAEVSEAAPASKTPAAPADDTSRASAIMKAQAASIVANDKALVGTFAPGALVLVPDPRSATDDTTGLREAIARLEPGAAAKDVSISKIVAGGNADAVWWSAELAVKRADGKTTTVRATELATKDAGWKVVAGAFAEVRAPSRSADPPTLDQKFATSHGPLSDLLANAKDLSTALAPAAVVLGTDKGETAWDAASAKKLLAGWTKLEFHVDGDVREQSGTNWAFAIANIDWNQPGKKNPARMGGLVISDGHAHVVAAHYTAY
jgi:hypothetical protein